MITVRNGVFETNSSSTHCVTLMSSDDFKKFSEGECWYDFASHEIMSIEDIYQSFMALAEKKNYTGKKPTLEDFKKALVGGRYDPFSDNEVEGFTKDERHDLDDVFWYIEHESMFVRYDGIGDFETYTKGDSVAVSCYIHE